MSKLVPAVTVDIADDGCAYVITARPWPTVGVEAHPFTARLARPTWHDVKVAKFVRTLMATYPKARA